MRFLLAVLLLGGALTTTTGPATALAPTSASYDEPRYEIEPFHPRSSDDARLVRAWRAWQGRAHSRYRTVVGHSCECVPEGRVKTDVEDGEVTSVTDLHSDDQLERHGYEMEELFRILRTAYAESDGVVATYHRGALSTIAIDRRPRRPGPEERYLVRLRQADEAADFAYAVLPFRLGAEDRAVLRRNWQTWRDRAIRDYSITATLQAGEGDFPTLRTRVEGPLVSGVREIDDAGQPGEMTSEHGHEVEQLYRLLRRLYRTADGIVVRYDNRGVPRFISADPDAAVVDDEFVLKTMLSAT